MWAVVHDQVIQTALGYFMAPLGTILIGVVVFKERLHLAQRIAVGLAVASLVVLTVSFGRVPWLALAIAVSWSLYGWMKKRVPLSPLESMSAESLLLAIGGGLIGLGVSAALTSVAASATGVAAAVRPSTIGWSLAAASVSGLLAGWYPARRAARLEIVSALRAD